jgi:2-isopropylmalate synthase
LGVIRTHVDSQTRRLLEALPRVALQDRRSGRFPGAGNTQERHRSDRLDRDIREQELVAANGGPVHAVDNAAQDSGKTLPQLSEVKLEEFDVRLLHHGEAAEDDENGAGGLVRVLAIFSDGADRWGTVGVAADILQASVECIIDGLEWKLRGEHKH